MYENDLSALKNSELAPTFTHDARNEENLKQELNVHCLSNMGTVPPTEHTATATPTNYIETQIVEPATDTNEDLSNNDDSIERERKRLSISHKVPAGAIDLRDKYKEHLMKRFDTKIIRRRNERRNGD